MRILVAVCVLFTVAGTGYGIKCYRCNSYLDKDCKTLASGKPEQYLEECGTNVNGEQAICRKLDMHLDMDFGEKHPAENRIKRDCGWKEDEETKDQMSSCYYKSGYNTRTWVCSCKEDGCNPATVPTVPALLLILSAVVVAVLRGTY